MDPLGKARNSHENPLLRLFFAQAFSRWRFAVHSGPMGVLRESGSTRLTLSSLAAPTEVRDELLDAVRQTAGGEYEVFGEIARSQEGTIAYLARDRHDKKLVALRLTRGASEEYRSEEHTSELQSRVDLVCRLLLEKKKNRALIATWIILHTYSRT